MTNLQAKISKILEGEFSNYYTEREEIESATAQLLALFDKEMKEIIGKNSKCKGYYWQVRCTLRQNQKQKLAKVMKGKHE